ncbi:MAG: YiiX/YebB-like N1pC/P60 family cysteine hydrolase [Ferruginibacter sp.]
MKKFKKISLRIFIALAALYLLLLIPEPSRKAPANGNAQKAFVWNRDSVWLSLEKDFTQVRAADPRDTDSLLRLKQAALQAQLEYIRTHSLAFDDTVFSSLENNFFALAPFVAANPNQAGWYTTYYNNVRTVVKEQSQHWDLRQQPAVANLYRLLYGMRAATEEVILQADSLVLPASMPGREEYSATPAADILGIKVHSGDILVSRGGAEVSALISRGNDYPGNFSHIAFLYVDEKTNKPWLIESHIEKGVAIADATQYLEDKKLRCMVMRPRYDLPALQADSMLPHKVAKAMYEESFTRHIPYDFKMNFTDSAKMFCSEVASYSYRKKGIRFWQQLSTISSSGVVDWLHDFGVENFATQMPSDLEYDPQLAVVAEWRDPETLYKDHIDNAVMDAMLEQANAGQQIDYNIWQLPFVRIIKAWCSIKNLFGYEGIIPEGMSATTALKNQWLVNRNRRITEKVKAMADDFRKKEKYRPPYWKLLSFAREAAAN